MRHHKKHTVRWATKVHISDRQNAEASTTVVIFRYVSLFVLAQSNANAKRERIRIDWACVLHARPTIQISDS
jgi:hypothetical protein